MKAVFKMTDGSIQEFALGEGWDAERIFEEIALYRIIRFKNVALLTAQIVTVRVVEF